MMQTMVATVTVLILDLAKFYVTLEQDHKNKITRTRSHIGNYYGSFQMDRYPHRVFLAPAGLWLSANRTTARLSGRNAARTC